MKNQEASNVFSWFLRSLGGYPLAILHEFLLSFSMEKRESSKMFPVGLCSILLGYPLAILHEKRFVFNDK